MRQAEFKPSHIMITCTKAVFLAMAVRDTIKPIVEGYEREILNDMKPLDDEGNIITEPEHAWLMGDDLFIEYDRRCRQARDKAGLRVEKDEFCPLLVANDNVRKAERMLIISMKQVTGLQSEDDVYYDIDLYNEFVDLSLRLMAPFVKM